MIRPNFDPFVLLCYTTTDMQLSGLSVEVNGCNMDEKGYVDAGGGGTPSGGLGRYSTDGRCTEEVGGCDEVIGMPLSTQWSAWKDHFKAMVPELTMSSGSSGKRVIVPEPSLSIFCLMRRIVAVALANGGGDLKDVDKAFSPPI
jgi:hypothetical protein